MQIFPLCFMRDFQNKIIVMGRQRKTLYGWLSLLGMGVGGRQGGAAVFCVGTLTVCTRQPLILYNLAFQTKGRLRITRSLALDHTAKWHQRPPETRVPDSIAKEFFPVHQYVHSSSSLPQEKQHVSLTLSWPWNVPTLLSPLHSPLSYLTHPVNQGHKCSCGPKGQGGAGQMLTGAPIGIALDKSPGSRAQVSTTAKQKEDSCSIIYHEQRINYVQQTHLFK